MGIKVCKNDCNFCCTKIENLSVQYGKNKVLDNIFLHLHCRELTTIIGKNGAGKSTLLKAILKEIPYSGRISFSSKHNNSNILTVGYVPQRLNIEDAPISVYDLICSHICNIPVFIGKNKNKYKKIKEHLKEFGVENLIDKKISTLSGGEIQRILISIATMPCPELLVLDEPLSGIDAKGKKELYKLLEKLKKDYDISILMVSHDFEYVREYSDKVILLDKKILKMGTAKEVLESNQFAKEFRVEGI